MTAHLSTGDIEKYRSKAITADEVRVIDGHLSGCEQCRRSFVDSERIDAAYEAVRYSLRSASQSAEPHIEYEELAAYVDGHLDAIARDVVEAHMKACPDCDTDVARMMSLRDAILSDKEAVTSAVPFWQRTTFRIGIEAAAVLLLIAAVWWFSIRQIQSLRAENEKLWKSVKESDATIADLKSRIDSLGPAVARGATASEGEITVQIKDGDSVVAIDAGGNLRGLEGLPQEYREAVRNLLQTGKVTTPRIIARLRGNHEILMNRNTDEPGFSLSTPVGVVLETTRPTFHWTKSADATEYEVRVSDAKGEFVRRAKVSGTSWQPSDPLARGRVYQWQVRAIMKDGREIKAPSVRQPDAKFSILDRSMLNKIEQARSVYSNSHLLMGTLYTKAGLVDEARREFRFLLEANPESSIASRILGSLNRR
jgi:hypothetical protein